MNYNYIAIEGTIGAGKTTLSTRIANDFNGKLVLEEFEAVTENTDFAADVVIEALLRADRAAEFDRRLTELTAGTVVSEDAGETFRGVKIR